MNPPYQIIGRTDRVDFPDLGLHEVAVKIDTGAEGSVLHCEEITLLPSGILHFVPLSPTHPNFQPKGFEVTEFFEVPVRNSFGQRKKRFIVELQVLVFGQLITTPFSLTNRAKMKYPALLGCWFLENGFLVDVTKKNLSFNNKII